MKLAISNGVFTWTIEGTDGINPKDFVSVINNASLSTSKFIELYYDYFTECKDHRKAYDRVEKLHENMFSKRKYSDYDNFRSAKSKFMNKR